MSDRVPPAPLEEQMDDVLAVLDAAGCERPTVLAETEGTALACLFAATHPERVRSLALFAPIPRISPRRTTRGRTIPPGARSSSSAASAAGGRA
jgi:pimeloyl-ACP methyl ester carboxylesterase